MSKKNILNKKIISLLVIGAVALVGYFFQPDLNIRQGSRKQLNQVSSVTDNHDYDNILVTRVVDGDTLKLENGKYLRLLGDRKSVV